MARKHGHLPLRAILPRLKCEGCGGRPAHASIVDDPRGGEYCVNEPIAVLP